MSWFGWVWASAAVPCLLACSLGGDDSESCNLNAVAGLKVTIVNGGAPNGECAASVTATDGSYSEALNCSANGTACQCYGAYERPGDYTVRATKNGGGSAETTASVRDVGCHVEAVELTLDP